MTDYEDIAEALHLNSKSDDETINNDRALALRHLRSGAPIPQTLLTKVERAAQNTEEKTNG